MAPFSISARGRLRLGRSAGLSRGPRYTRKASSATRPITKKSGPVAKPSPRAAWTEATQASALLVRRDVAVDQVADVVRRPLPPPRGRCRPRRRRASSSTSMSSTTVSTAFSSPASTSSSDTMSTPAGATSSVSSSSSFEATRARTRRALEDRSAFRADDRILVEIEEFGPARLTLALGAELGFCHCGLFPVVFKGGFRKRPG